MGNLVQRLRALEKRLAEIHAEDALDMTGVLRAAVEAGRVPGPAPARFTIKAADFAAMLDSMNRERLASDREDR